jgi:hypothetical protein
MRLLNGHSPARLPQVTLKRPQNLVVRRTVLHMQCASLLVWSNRLPTAQFKAKLAHEAVGDKKSNVRSPFRDSCQRPQQRELPPLPPLQHNPQRSRATRSRFRYLPTAAPKKQPENCKCMCLPDSRARDLVAPLAGTTPTTDLSSARRRLRCL